MPQLIEMTWEGPFKVRQSGSTGCEVLDADGHVVCWTQELATALLIASLLDQVF